MKAFSMSTMTPVVQPPAVPDGACYPPFRMSVDQYEKLVESGVFTKRDRFQLIHGILVAKVTQNPPHSVADLLCGKALARVVPPQWHVRPDKPVRLPPDGEPEPDQCVVRGAERDYSQRHPGAADVGLVVEISDTSLAADREVAHTYGARGIPVYWIVNLVDSQVEVHTMPTADGYALMNVYGPADDVPVALDGVVVGRIAVSEILP
jgi:Uma2 family endonuclease